jgi:hypothetical protein
MNRQDAENAKKKERDEPDADLDRLAHRVIGAAIEVHRLLGPGFLEVVYEEALCVELSLQRIPFGCGSFGTPRSCGNCAVLVL